MLYNPFQNATKKANKYLWMALGVSFVLSTIGLILTEDKNRDTAKNSDYLFLLMTLFNIAFAAIAMTFVYMRLNQGGMSSELKSQISRRYLEFVLIFVVLSLPINQLLKPEYKYNSDLGYYVAGTNYAIKWRTPICGFGLVMAISRLRDPLIRIKTVNIWMRITCRSQRIKEDINKELRKTNLNAFLRSTLNTELVISILKGITILAATSSDNVDNIADSDMLRVRQTVTIEIKKFKIRDADNFNIQKKTEKEESKEMSASIKESFKASVREEEEGEQRMTVLDEDSSEEEEQKFDLNRTRTFSNNSRIGSVSDFGRNTSVSNYGEF